MWTENNVGIPHKEQTIENIKVKEYQRLDVENNTHNTDGDNKLAPSYRPDLAKIKAKLQPATTKIVKRNYPSYAPYEEIEDSLQIPSLEEVFICGTDLIKQAISSTI